MTLNGISSLKRTWSDGLISQGGNDMQRHTVTYTATVYVTILHPSPSLLQCITYRIRHCMTILNFCIIISFCSLLLLYNIILPATYYVAKIGFKLNSNPPASVSRVLGLQAWTTTPWLLSALWNTMPSFFPILLVEDPSWDLSPWTHAGGAEKESPFPAPDLTWGQDC